MATDTFLEGFQRRMTEQGLGAGADGDTDIPTVTGNRRGSRSATPRPSTPRASRAGAKSPGPAGATSAATAAALREAIDERATQVSLLMEYFPEELGRFAPPDWSKVTSVAEADALLDRAQQQIAGHEGPEMVGGLLVMLGHGIERTVGARDPYSRGFGKTVEALVGGPAAPGEPALPGARQMKRAIILTAVRHHRLLSRVSSPELAIVYLMATTYSQHREAMQQLAAAQADPDQSEQVEVPVRG